MNALLMALCMPALWQQHYGVCDDCANDRLALCLHLQAKNVFPVHTPYRRKLDT